MASLIKFPIQIHCKVNLSQNLHFPSKPYPQFLNHLNFNAYASSLKIRRSGFSVNVLKTQKKPEPEIDSEDDEEEVLGDDDDDEFLGDDDDEIIVPLENMKKWLESRPRGFGEGKEYDTAIEDKLMEEIEQSRKAAKVSSDNKLKNVVEPKPSTKSTQIHKDVHDGFRIRLVNLPKKKNIHKDLKLAFKGIPGIVSIVPLVSGNEKTRDPVCTGLAFVDFKYKADAHRFADNFSGESIMFGKVEKKIKCEIMDPMLPKALLEQSVDKIDTSSRQRLPKMDKDLNTSVNKTVTSSRQRLPKLDKDLNTGISTRTLKKTAIVEKFEDGEIKVISETREFDLGEKQESEINSTSSKKVHETKSNGNKVVASKRKTNKNPKIKIPGSANRLKSKDKTVLTGVFSKYGSSANLVSSK